MSEIIRGTVNSTYADLYALMERRLSRSPNGYMKLVEMFFIAMLNDMDADILYLIAMGLERMPPFSTKWKSRDTDLVNCSDMGWYSPIEDIAKRIVICLGNGETQQASHLIFTMLPNFTYSAECRLRDYRIR